MSVPEYVKSPALTSAGLFLFVPIAGTRASVLVGDRHHLGTSVQVDIQLVVGDGDFSSRLSRCGTDWNKITFTGRLNKEQLYDFYQIADIGVMPSMHEQCSYVAIEMMMFGLPMVVSTTPGLKGMMRNGDFGYTFDMEKDSEKSKNELTDLIIKVLKAPLRKREKMKSLSRSSYEEKYSVQEMQKKYLNLIFPEQ